MSEFNKEHDLILFFSPEAEVTPHFMAQCLIARNLKLLGYTPVFAFCPAILCRCPVMDMKQMNFDSVDNNRNQACGGCIVNFVNTLKMYDLSWVSMQDCLPQGAREYALKLTEQAPADILGFKYENMPVGKIAFGDYAITNKSWVLNTEDTKQRQAWEHYAASCIISYIAVDILCTKLPIKRIVRFNEYSNNLAAYFAGKKHDLPVFTITAPSHRGNDASKLMIFSKTWIIELKQELKTWPAWREAPLDSEMINEITDDIFHRFSSVSSFTYSPAKTMDASNLRQQFNLDPDKKLLVAFSSSPDERAFTNQLLEIVGYNEPAPSQPFNDHIEWFKCLIDYVENSHDLQLLIRIHPREGPCERYNTTSQHLGLLKQHFSKEYRNCRIIWPEESISSYDLIEIADLGLTSWSTIGIEMSRLAVPVISAFRDISFPDDDFHRWGGPTPADYLAILREQLEWSPSMDSLARSFRCYYKYRLGNCVSMADTVPSSSYWGFPQFSTPSKEAPTLKSVFIDQKNILDINLSRLTQNCAKTERLTLLRSIERILFYLLTGNDKPENLEVTINSPAPGDTDNSSGCVYLYSSSRGYISLKVSGESTQRYSPLGYRLLRLLENNISKATQVNIQHITGLPSGLSQQ